MKLKKGDNVKMTVGKDRGKTGTVIAAFPREERVTVEGLNLVKKRAKPRVQGESGQTVAVARPIAASKVMLICPNCKQPTRIGGRVDGGRKVRYCKKCKAII